MKRFYEYPSEMTRYFEGVDRRFSCSACQSVEPGVVACHLEDMSDIKVVLWDVYGTLCGVDVGDLEMSLGGDERLIDAARLTVEEFGLAEALGQVGDGAAEVVLKEWYVRLIEESHAESAAKGVAYPEVVIEQLWLAILKGLIEVGYGVDEGERLEDVAFKWAYFFDSALQRTFFYEHTVVTLGLLKQCGVVQGIISNAQFYTPLHLKRLFDQSCQGGKLTLGEIFDDELIFFSYELGCSKPNPLAFEKALAILKKRGIGAGEVLYVGNDMLNDVWAAKANGLKAVLFAGDKEQVRLRVGDERCEGVTADAVVTELISVADMVVIK